MKRNIYTALRFAERPELHLTVRYYPNVEKDGDFEFDLVRKVEALCLLLKPIPFRLELGEQAKFGPRKNIPVLLVTGFWPAWTNTLRMVVPVTDRDSYGFRPHVTTDLLPPLKVTVTSIAIMHKKLVCREWMLGR